MDPRDKLLKTSCWAVRIAGLLNRLFLGSVLLGLAFSFIFSTRFAAMLLYDDPRVNVASEMVGLRLLMLIGVAIAIGSEVLLVSLRKILSSADDGDPFVTANVGRLQTIGWSLLGLQLLDFPAALLTRAFPSLGTAAPEISFSPGGWLAVLMVFVLSRVFAAGSVLKDDLEGTV